jgi:SAM-dependent methyltransferase
MLDNPVRECPACGVLDKLQYLDKSKVSVQCEKCKSIFRKKLGDLQLFVKPESLSFTSSVLHKVGIDVIYKRYYKIIVDAYVDYLKAKTNMNFKNALDVGAHIGSLVLKLNKLGIDTEGIESDARFLKSRITDKIRYGYFDENYKIQKKFDLICLTQMLYYTKNSLAILKHVKSMLTENGIIFIASYNTLSSFMSTIIPLEEEYLNMILSKMNFESLRTSMGLELVDYTTYRGDLFLPYKKNKTRFDLVKRHIKFYFKKGFVSDPNGQFVYLLLKPVHMDKK